MTKITRRDMLKSAGAAAATTAIAGAATAAMADESEGWEPEWTDEADVVIVGYGGSGATAALAAATEGATVIALEACEYNIGGNFGCSHGALHDCPGADVDEWYDCYLRGSFQTNDHPEDVKEVLAEAAGMDAWLAEYGIEINWNDQGDPTGHTFPVSYKEGFIANRDGIEGHYLFEAVDEKAQATGLVEVKLGTKAEHLVQRPVTREIVGVIANGPDGQIAVKAHKGVIVSAGSFEHNAVMQANYMYPGVFMINSGVPTNDGSGIKMCQEVGADLWHMNEWHSAGFQAVLPSQQARVSVGPEMGDECGYIYVDCNGKRFLNEKYAPAHNSDVKPAFDFASPNAFNKQQTGSNDPAVLKYTDRVSDYVHLPMFIIFDQSAMDGADPILHTKKPGGLLMGYDAVMPFYNPDKKFLTCLTNEEAINAQWIFKGNTLEELAANIKGLRPSGVDWDKVEGIPAENLVEAVATYNQYCADGYDPDFERDPETLIPLAEEGPYYAIQMQNGLDFTEGGPKRNGKCQTVDPFYQPIPRLYNTGECGSFNSLVYAIGGIVQALTTGRIAGRGAAALEPWD